MEYFKLKTVAIVVITGMIYTQISLADSRRVDGKDPERGIINKNERKQLKENRLQDEHNRSKKGVLPKDADVFEHVHERHKKELGNQ